MNDRRPILALLAALSLCAVPPAPASGQTPAGAEIGAKVLPSVVALDIQAPDGGTAAGVGFLTIKDGIMATSWRLVNGARRVVARFPNGDEYECSGVIDKDEKRDVALVRIKVFGRPVLTLAAVELAGVAQVRVAAVKDGAFGLVPARIAALGVLEGIDVGRLEGDIPDGTSGSPVVDGGGAVVGLLTTRTIDGKATSFVLPAAYILALDATLPTQPWGGTPDAKSPPASTPAMANEEVEARIGRALMAVSEDSACLAWAGEFTRGFGFLSGVPDVVYQMQQNLDTAISALNEVRTDDALRLRLGRAVLQVMVNQKAASENFIRAVVIGQQAKAWGAQSQDAQKRSNSMIQGIAAQIAGLKEDLKALEADSAKFREFLPFEQRYLLGLAERHSGFRLGVTTYPRNPFSLLIVGADSLAQKIGLRPGDHIVSAGGRAFTAADDFEEFKLLIKANLGRKLDAVVERSGKAQPIVLKIPKEIPPDALYVP